MNMRQISPKAGFEPAQLAFQPSVLTITPHRLPDSITLSTPISVCGTLPERVMQTTNIYIYIIGWWFVGETCPTPGVGGCHEAPTTDFSECGQQCMKTDMPPSGADRT